MTEPVAADRRANFLTRLTAAEDRHDAATADGSTANDLSQAAAELRAAAADLRAVTAALRRLVPGTDSNG